jgi:hypothetical protein
VPNESLRSVCVNREHRARTFPCMEDREHPSPASCYSGTDPHLFTGILSRTYKYPNQAGSPMQPHEFFPHELNVLVPNKTLSSYVASP